jgi:DNA invertase Pin-like site-specific DNA recombinase
MKIGYARVSSNNQDLTIQIEQLKAFGCNKIYSEQISGKNNHRPELTKMIDNLTKDDIVVVTKIDRLARSLKGLIEILESFNEKQSELISLDQSNKVDTTNPMGKAFLQIAGVFAELERNMINVRTKEGIEQAKSNGIKLGRKSGVLSAKTLEISELVKKLVDSKTSYQKIATQFKISKSTISKIVKMTNETPKQ